MNLKIEGLFTLRSPLSHIGKTHSTHTYLVQEPVLQDDGGSEEIFVYQGNAWRGQLRDLMATYMLTKLDATVPVNAFHFLFSGGRMGGEIKVDLGQMRALRKAAPMVALLGGGVGNQILPGKTRVSSCVPLCMEAMPRLPEYLHEKASSISYRQLTFEQSYSRKDDSKDDRLLPYMKDIAGLLEGETKKKDGPADQMRMTVELLCSGAQLYSSVYFMDVSELELGCFVSALDQFSLAPHIGGQANRGHGNVDVEYNMDGDGFARINSGAVRLSATAEQAKQTYDQHLKELYDAMLEKDGNNIIQLLETA